MQGKDDIIELNGVHAPRVPMKVLILQERKEEGEGPGREGARKGEGEGKEREAWIISIPVVWVLLVTSPGQCATGVWVLLVTSPGQCATGGPVY